jgi:hypothetical protein
MAFVSMLPFFPGQNRLWQRALDLYAKCPAKWPSVKCVFSPFSIPGLFRFRL